MTLLSEDGKVLKMLEINLRRNRAGKFTDRMEELTGAFDYQACKDVAWTPEEYSLYHGSPLWEQSSPAQRLSLNHLYWAAYYTQIISAEIATITYNQICAAALYAIESFRPVADTLDLETLQERTHIHAFKTISLAVEEAVFGRRVFTKPMHHFLREPMIYPRDRGALYRAAKWAGMGAYAAVAACSPFVASQYFAVRGLRTLNGKLVQQKLHDHCAELQAQGRTPPIPSEINLCHFKDESHHFTSSLLLARDLLRVLPKPGRFEKLVANLGVLGSQDDQRHFNCAVPGIFWDSAALIPPTYEMLRSPLFGMQRREALEMIDRCLCREHDGYAAAVRSQQTVLTNYRAFAEPLDYLWPVNRSMSRMASCTLVEQMGRARRALAAFERRAA